MKKLAIVTTHPIQYYAPVFQLLAQRGRIAIRVFYTDGRQDKRQFDPGFNKVIAWDIPLLEGYDYEWVPNESAEPGSHHYRGIINPALIAQLKTWSPDAILFFGWAYQSHLGAMRYFKRRVPVYFRGDSTLLNEENGVKKWLKYFFLKWVYRHVDHAFYVGQNNKAYFKRYGLREGQLSFAPHAIDNERFQFVRAGESAALRSTLGLTKGDVLVLYAGKFEKVKNVSLLLDAFIRLEHKHVHLLLVGNGPLEEEIRSQVKNSAAAERIHFLDFQNQSYMPVLYQAADLFCLPSLSETWGLAVNEAMACGRAVIVSDKVGCAADLVLPGVNGDIFKTADEEGLLDCLRQDTVSPGLLQDFGRNSALMITDWCFLRIAETIENKLTA